MVPDRIVLQKETKATKGLDGLTIVGCRVARPAVTLVTFVTFCKKRFHGDPRSRQARFRDFVSFVPLW